MAKEEQIQEKYIKFQVINQQLKQLQQQLQLIEQQIMEMTIAKQALEDIKNTKEGTEIFVPISGGVFAKAELKDTKELLLNVGSGVAVHKDIDGSKEIIEKQLEELNKLHDQCGMEINQTTLQAHALQQELAKLM